MIPSQSQSLAEWDPEIFNIIEEEKKRQWKGIELIASENFTSRAVLECLGSALTNKYCEGFVGHRYYSGAEFCDQIEQLAMDRSLQAFGLDPAVWGVCVQPYSGSPANFAVYTALLQPHERFMGLDLPHGGHLTHGFQTPKRKVSATSLFWESMPYRLNEATGTIDTDMLHRTALLFRPKLIVMGASAYPREYDYERFRATADAVGASLMMDMAHFSGLVAAGVLRSPFEFCDIVTTTTHKSLRGPRSGMIFYRKTDRKTGQKNDLQNRIEQAVFPGLQGGPHMHQIAAIATQMKEVQLPEFRVYAQQVVRNAQACAEALIALGHTVLTGGTDNHLLLWDLRPKNIQGARVDLALSKVAITTNKNSLPGDKSAINPGGVRIGSPAMTSRGLKEADFRQIATFINRAFQIAIAHHGPSVNDDAFEAAVNADPATTQLRHEVESFAMQFPMPGFDVTAYRAEASAAGGGATATTQ